MKKIIFLLVALIFIVGVAQPVNASNFKEIKVYVDGEEVNFPDQKPYVDSNGRTLVPVRFPAEKFGAEVEWEPKERRVDITHKNKNKKINLWIGRSEYTVNNVSKQMDTEAVLTNSRTMIPIRFVAEALDIKVDWKQVEDIGIVFNFTKGQSEKEMQNEMNKIVEQITGKPVEKFIDPKISVLYTTNEKNQNNYFQILLTNEDEYRGKQYTTKVECISHPRLNFLTSKGISKNVDINMIDFFKQDTKNLKSVLYELNNLKDTQYTDTKGKVILKEGEKLQYKVTISNGVTSKSYKVNVEFKNKDFQ